MIPLEGYALGSANSPITGQHIERLTCGSTAPNDLVDPGHEPREEGRVEGLCDGVSRVQRLIDVVEHRHRLARLVVPHLRHHRSRRQRLLDADDAQLEKNNNVFNFWMTSWHSGSSRAH